MGRSAQPTAGGLDFLDDEGARVALDAEEAASLLAFTDGLDAATVSACPECRSRVVAVVALVDLLEQAPPHPRVTDLVDLADQAPTLHLYVVDTGSTCEHRRWRDPGFAEWLDAVDEPSVRTHRP
ncbi:MAG: hypothetical protein JOZ99_05030 [Actinobacteria bacterium]|nr:hypothetical protein [Actinomycetota bacterium]